MKRTIVIMGGTLLSMIVVSAKAQQTWDPKNNPTVDSITSKYESKLVKPVQKPVTTEDVFPVVGTYQSSSGTDAGSVKITLDAENKGIVWIEGLPQGKIKGLLKKSPATYKIPVQKTEDGKDVAEGTLVFEKDANKLSICIGRPYNDTNPETAFAPIPEEEQVVAKNKTGKSKTKEKATVEIKPWLYSGSKMNTTAAVLQ